MPLDNRDTSIVAFDWLIFWSEITLWPIILNISMPWISVGEIWIFNIWLAGFGYTLQSKNSASLTLLDLSFCLIIYMFACILCFLKTFFIHFFVKYQTRLSLKTNFIHIYSLNFCMKAWKTVKNFFAGG